MIMKLDDEYFVDTDPYNFILRRKTIIQKGDNKGSEAISTISFHGKLSHLLKKYIDITMFKGDEVQIEHINNVINYLEKIDKRIDEISKEIDISFLKN